MWTVVQATHRKWEQVLKEIKQITITPLSVLSLTASWFLVSSQHIPFLEWGALLSTAAFKQFCSLGKNSLPLSKVSLFLHLRYHHCQYTWLALGFLPKSSFAILTVQKLLEKCRAGDSFNLGLFRPCKLHCIGPGSGHHGLQVLHYINCRKRGHCGKMAASL